MLVTISYIGKNKDNIKKDKVIIKTIDISKLEAVVKEFGAVWVKERKEY